MQLAAGQPINVRKPRSLQSVQGCRTPAFGEPPPSSKVLCGHAQETVQATGAAPPQQPGSLSAFPTSHNVFLVAELKLQGLSGKAFSVIHLFACAAGTLQTDDSGHCHANWARNQLRASQKTRIRAPGDTSFLLALLDTVQYLHFTISGVTLAVSLPVAFASPKRCSLTQACKTRTPFNYINDSDQQPL